MLNKIDKDAEFTGHSCAGKNQKLNSLGGCAGCGIKELANCTENEK